jgi:TRAP-type C4-dicarboxylate transport system permease small subunit
MAARGPNHRWIGVLDLSMAWVNRAMLLPSMLALLFAAGILTYSVFSRYYFKVPTDWQDEAAVFLLVGATFISGSYVQSYRGHIGIDAVAGILPSGLNHARKVLADLATALFCAFFSWKSWTLLAEAIAEGQTTTSSWGPPLAIPYSTMAVGMSLVGLQAALQFAQRLLPREAPR